jgi:Spy/CpxP family protein refolding chaperone
MKRGMMIQLGLGALALTGMIALAPAFAEDATTKPSKDSTLAGPKPEGSAPKGKDFGGGNKKEGQNGPIEKILKNLSLTEDQETKIKGLMKAFGDKRTQFEAENKVAMEGLKTQFEQAKAVGDKAKLDALHEQKKAIEKGAPKRDELIAQISDVLTPEQREKFREQIKDHVKSMNEGKGMGDKEGKHMKNDGTPKEKKHEKGKDQLKL